MVEAFNEILKTEEHSVSVEFEDLSLKEIHVIEAVCVAEKQGKDNRVTAIAEVLRVTPGTLTTAVTLLEKKGYLLRRKDEIDKRVVRIYSTELGKQAEKRHAQFHREMVEDVLASVNEEEAATLARALGNISAFFRKKQKQTETGGKR